MDNDMKYILTLLAFLGALVVGYLLLKGPAITVAAKTFILIEERADSLRGGRDSVESPKRLRQDTFSVPADMDNQVPDGPKHCNDRGVCWRIVE